MTFKYVTQNDNWLLTTSISSKDLHME